MDIATLPSQLTTSLLNVLIQHLTNFATETVRQIWNVDEEFEELVATYENIKPQIDQLVSEHQESSALKFRSEQLVGLCYAMENLLDEINLMSLKNPDRISILREIFSPSSKQVSLRTPGDIASLLKKMKQILSWIQGLSSAQSSSRPHPPADPSRWRRPLLDEAPLHSGITKHRDEQTKALIKELQDDGSDGVSIIGMDGLGKTTLARSIMVDDTIHTHFPIILTASVSGIFPAEDIFNKLSQEYKRRRRHTKPTQSGQTFEGPLCSQRSLVILDDLWSVELRDWDLFKNKFLRKSPGSKILITTRNPGVAKVTNTSEFYLSRMTDGDCRELIKRKANLSRYELRVYSDDLQVIAKKCKGMPVVSDQVGLLLSNKLAAERKSIIQRLRNEDLWRQEELKDAYLLLNLYDQLKSSPLLRRCFAYCSLFPPNHLFNRDDLVQFWELEGFIPHQDSNRPFEDMLSKSIFQPNQSTSNNLKSYEMHEFNQEFAHRVGHKVFHRVDKDTSSSHSFAKVYHLSLLTFGLNPLVSSLKDSINKCKQLRTFLLFHCSVPTECNITLKDLCHLKYLRLIDLSHTSTCTKSLSSLSNHKHLRYLDLSNTIVTSLSDSICSLLALKVLKLTGCSNLKQLPKKFSQLISLTHLYVDMQNVKAVSYNLGGLTKLEVLNSFFVSKNESQKVQELKDMKCLKEIQIFGLQNIRDKEEAQKTMLSEKTLLQKLVLQWDDEHVNADDVLEALEPHYELGDLEVRNYGGETFPEWLGSASFRLERLSLKGCKSCQALPSLGQLPLLNNLQLQSIHEVENLDHQFHGQGGEAFYCLEFLEIDDMKGLVDWTGLQAGDMPSLRVLKISACSKLVLLPSFEHLSWLRELEISSCQELQSLPKLPSSTNGGLPRLSVVKISDCPKLTKLPSLEHLSCLMELDIDSCQELQSLTNLPSSTNGDHLGLRVLKIRLCPKLVSLPSFEQSHWKLEIVRCPGLSTESSCIQANSANEKEPTRQSKRQSCCGFPSKLFSCFSKGHSN